LHLSCRLDHTLITDAYWLAWRVAADAGVRGCGR
jgi:hypothetical protein